MGANANIALICGPDDFLVQREATRRWESMREGIDDFGQEVLDGRAGTQGEVENAVSRTLAAIQTLPMFGDRKVVWLREVSFLADSALGKTEATLRQVNRLQSGLSGLDPNSVQLLISASPIDRRRREYKWFQENTKAVFLGEARRSEESLLPILMEEATRLKVRFAPGAAEILIAKVNGNSRLAVEEVRKLATWLGDESDRIEEEHIANLVPAFAEGDFFEAAEAFFSRNLAWTLDAIRRHFFAGYESRSLLSNLQNRNRILIQIRVLLDSGELGLQLSKATLERAARTYAHHFGDSSDKTSLNLFTQNPWYLGRLAQSAKAFPLRRLLDFQAEFLRAFTEILRRPHDEELVIREMAIRCLSGK